MQRQRRQLTSAHAFLTWVEMIEKRSCPNCEGEMIKPETTYALPQCAEPNLVVKMERGLLHEPRFRSRNIIARVAHAQLAAG
jgi:hypothetical protein